MHNVGTAQHEGRALRFNVKQIRELVHTLLHCKLETKLVAILHGIVVIKPLFTVTRVH